MKANIKNISKSLIIKSIFILMILTQRNEKIYSQSGWFVQNSGVTENLNDVYFINSQTGWIAGNYSVLKTTNGGNNWIVNDVVSCPPSGLYSICFANANNGMVGGYSSNCFPDNLLYKTSNGGSNWNRLYFIGGSYNTVTDIMFVDANTGFFCVGGGDMGYTWGSIHKTTNGGQNWSGIYSGNYAIGSVTFETSLTGWASGYFSQEFPEPTDTSFIIKTTDGGSSWLVKYSSTESGYGKLFFIKEFGWGLGNDTIIHTTDGGDNWTFQKLNRQASFQSVYFIDQNTGWAAGNFGADTTNIIKTTNGGTNWFDLKNNDNTNLTSVIFTDVNSGWAVGPGGKILKTTTGGITIPALTLLTDKYHGGSGDGYSSSIFTDITNYTIKIDSVNPRQNAVSANKSSDILIFFKSSMDASTINTSNIKVHGSQTGNKSCAVAYDAGLKKAIINPNGDFKVGEKIMVTLKSGIKNSTGDTIRPFVYSFTVQSIGGTAQFIKSPQPGLATSAYYMSSGDFDSDGDLDAAVTDYYDFKILKNNGSGTFTLSQTIPFNGVSSIENADIDNDGDMDIVACSDLYYQMVLYKNNGSGVFSSAVTSYNTYALAYRLEDMDGDGLLEIVHAEGNSIVMKKLIGNILVSYTLFTFQSTVYYVNTGDLNNDGRIDIIATLENDSAKAVIKNENGSYSEATSFYGGPYSFPSSLSDIDSDGDLDLTIILEVGLANIFKNNGNAAFSLNSTISIEANGTYGFQQGTGDFDGDSDLDFALITDYSQNFSILKNSGTGDFQNAPLSYNSNINFAISSGDFDGDGDLDLTLGDNGSIALMINQPPADSPKIVSVTPLQNAINVNKFSNIVTTFSTDINSSTLNSSNIKVYGSQTGSMNCAISYNAAQKTATINPNTDFKIGEEITAIFTSSIQSLAATALTPFEYKFIISTSDGTGIFSGSSAIQLDGSPISVISGDFNNDNAIDILTLNEIVFDQQKVSLYVNDFPDPFALSTSFEISGMINTLESPVRILADDFDSDGDLDLVLGGSYGNIKSYFYQNNGSGVFSLSFSGTYSLPAFMNILVKGDFDIDGDIDLCFDTWDFVLGPNGAKSQSNNDNLNNFGQQSFTSIIMNDGNGSFQNPDYISFGNCNVTPSLWSKFNVSINQSDFNNDGLFDLAASGEAYPESGAPCNYMTVKLKNSDGSYSDIIYNGNASSQLLIGDFDGDLDEDIISFNLLFKNNGDGTFTQSSLNNGSGSTLSGDLDADGDLDIVSLGSNFVSVYKNNGNATFTPPTNFNTDADPNSISSGDFDGDGDLDFAVAINSDNTISILLNDVGIIPTTYNIRAAIEGFYNVSASKHNSRDTLRAYLRNVNSPFSIVDSSKTILDSATLTANFNFNYTPTGIYYIVLKHRNGLETWSKSGGEAITNGGTFNYDFTTSASQAYGSNLVLKSIIYCIYSGDVNRDGVIDGSDGSDVDADAQQFATGYLNTDLTGDSFVDGSDFTIVDNNSYNFVAARNPILGYFPSHENVKPLKSNKSNKRFDSDKAKSENVVPIKFELSDNYPNPFNPATKIKFSLPSESNVKLAVYDITGREISVLVNEKLRVGVFEYQWNASQSATGTYFYKITAGSLPASLGESEAGDFTEVKKMVLVK
ncbi:MAG: FG-GAP-like repeat-containing protein [bacterium]